MREIGRQEIARHPRVHLGLFPTQLVSLWGCANALPPLGAMSKTDQVETLRDRGLAQAAGRWRACKKLGMPIACNRARLKNWRSSLYLNQDNDRGSYGDRRGCLQQNAKRAVVGIGVYRMHVRHLNYGQQRQQDKAHHGDHRQSKWLCVASPAEI
jgi:hypothetical protein